MPSTWNQGRLRPLLKDLAQIPLLSLADRLKILDAEGDELSMGMLSAQKRHGDGPGMSLGIVSADGAGVCKTCWRGLC